MDSNLIRHLNTHSKLIRDNPAERTKAPHHRKCYRKLEVLRPLQEDLD